MKYKKTKNGKCTNEKILIYGINQQAQQLCRLIEFEKSARVCGFVVDEGFKKTEYLLGKKIYEFNEMLEKFSPKKYQILLSFGYKNMVNNRREKFEKCKQYGYRLYTYINKHAIVYTEEIGEGSIIYPNVFLAPFSYIGKGCFLENNVSIAHHSKCGDFCFFAPRAMVCGDTTIEEHCFIGANATIVNSIILRRRTLVTAGATVVKSTEEGTICWNPKNHFDFSSSPEEYI